MDPLEVLPVRFHFGGKFDFDGYSFNYVGGKVELSHIERDKLSLPELRGYLGDHVNLTVDDVVDFHWLSPGANMSDGLTRLADDHSCMYMSNCITAGGVAEVYVEIYKLVGGELVMWTCEPESKSIILGSPIKDQMVSAFDGNVSSDDESIEGTGTDEEGDNELEDSDYLLGDDDTSEDDEEANEFMTNARNQKKNPAITVAKSQKNCNHEVYEENDFLDESDPPMMDSSEEASYEDDDEGEGIRRKSRFIRIQVDGLSVVFVMSSLFARFIGLA